MRVQARRGGIWGGLLPQPRLIWMLFRRHLWLFCGVVALFIAAVTTWTVMQAPKFTARASLVLQPKSENVVGVVAVSPDLTPGSDAVDTIVQLLGTRSMALRVAGAYLASHGGDKGSAARAGLADRIDGIVTISRSGLTYVIDVTAKSVDPVFAADVANLYVQQFIVAQREAKSGATRSANAWLGARIEQLRRGAVQADAELQNYKIRAGLMSANGATMAEQEVSSLNQQIAQARADLAEKQGLLSAARAQVSGGGGGADVSAALGSSTIASLRQREAEASAQVAQLQSRYGALYPDLKKAQNNLADVRQQIQGEINRILSSLQADVNVASSRLSSLQRSQSGATGALASNNAAQVGLLELQRRSDAAKAIYQTFLSRYQETSAQIGLQDSDADVAAVAQVPVKPDFPNKKLAALFAVVGGFSSGLLAIAIAEYLRGGFRTKEEVERRLGVRYLGAVPSLKSTLKRWQPRPAPQDYVVANPHSIFAEAFRSLRVSLLRGAGGRPRVVALTSALPQEGKTTTAVCLARACASSGLRTVLVDCDLRRNGSTRLLCRERVGGLQRYLTGEITLDQALVTDEATGLMILPSGEEHPGFGNVLGEERLAHLFDELRERCDLVVVDTPPLLGIADARAVAAAADHVLMLVRWRKTSIHASEAALDLLLDARAPIVGVALTQVDVRHFASTGQSDVYGYYKQFREYYTN